MIGLVFNSAYMIVDGVFIGNVLGRDSMAAAAEAVPLVEALIGYLMLIFLTLFLGMIGYLLIVLFSTHFFAIFNPEDIELITFTAPCTAAAACFWLRYDLALPFSQ